MGKHYFCFLSDTKEQSGLYAISCLLVVYEMMHADDQTRWRVFADAGKHFRCTKLLTWALLARPPNTVDEVVFVVLVRAGPGSMRRLDAHGDRKHDDKSHRACRIDTIVDDVRMLVIGIDWMGSCYVCIMLIMLVRIGYKWRWCLCSLHDC